MRTRVPVEHRVLGMDRRLFLPAGVIAAVFLLWAVVLPAVDRAVPFRDQTVAGEQLLITPTVSFAAAPGWNLTQGLRVGQRTASGEIPGVVLQNGTADFEVSARLFSGSPAELLSQTLQRRSVSGRGLRSDDGADAAPIVTASGIDGVSTFFQQPSSLVRVIALVVEESGFVVTVDGPPERMSTVVDDVDGMIASIGPIGAAA